MTKNGKRLISWLLVCAMCFSLAPFAAAMSPDVQHGDYIFYDDFSGDLSKWQIVKDGDDTDTQMSITSAGTLNLGATNQQTCVPRDEDGQPLKVSGDWILTFDAISPASTNWTGIKFNMSATATSTDSKGGDFLLIRGNSEYNSLTNLGKGTVPNFDATTRKTAVRIEYTASTGHVKIYLNGELTIEVDRTPYMTSVFQPITCKNGQIDNFAVTRPDYLFYDDFSGGNNQWKSYRGNALTVSGGVASSSGIIETAPADESIKTVGDFELNVQLTPPGTGTNWAGVMFNMASKASDNWTKSGYFVHLKGNGTAAFLGKGVTTQTKTVENFKSQQMNTIRIEYTAATTNIKVYFNNNTTPTFDITDATYTSGYFSITTQSGGKFDNYSVKCPWLFYDDFSVNLNKWKSISAGMSVSAGQASASKSPSQIAPLDADGNLLQTTGDVIINCDVVSNNTWAGLRFNKPDGNEGGNWAKGYFLFVRNTGTADFYCCKSDGNKTLASGVSVPNFDTATKTTAIHVEYTAANGNIRIFFNGSTTPSIDVNDMTYTGGYTELIVNYTNKADNFSIIGTRAMKLNDIKELQVNYDSKELILPQYDGYTAAIYSSSNEEIVTLSGAVNTLKGGTSEIVLKYTDKKGNIVYSNPVSVFVKGLRQEIAETVKIASASDTNHHSAWPSSRLIDGELVKNTDNPECWSTDATVTTVDVTLTLQEANTITGVTLYPRYNNASMFPQGIKVYVSSDGNSWSDAVITKTGCTATDEQTPQTFYFEPVDDVKYVKFTFEKASGHIQLAEIEVLGTPALQTVEEVGEALTVAQMEDKIIMNYPQLYTAEITACTPAGLVDGEGNITLPATEDVQTKLSVKITERTDTSKTLTVTRDLLIKSAATLALEKVQTKTNLIPCPEADATKITLPAVPEGYSVEIVESDHPEVVDTDGNIMRSDDTTYGVRLTLKITDTATGDSRLTDPLLVPIYKTFVAPTMTQEEIDAVHADWKTKKYGWFVHFGRYSYRDGSNIQSTDEAANNFDVVQFAKDAAAHGYEYVVFTAWHAETRTLFPSMTNERWREDRRRDESYDYWKPYSDRDVIDELITELDKYGIDLHLYTHPTCGHDFKCEDPELCAWDDSSDYYGTWNQYTNELYYELCERYGNRIKGLWFDGYYTHVPKGEQQRRLYETCKTFNPAMILTQNDAFTEGQINPSKAFNGTDYHCWEVSRATVDYENNMTFSRHQAAICLGKTSQWAAMIPQDRDIGLPSVESVFRYLVATSSVSVQGGYLSSMGYYQSTPDTFDTNQNLWMKDVRQFYLDLNNQYLTPLKSSVIGTSVGVAYPTTECITVADLEWGVSTESTDGKNVYLHVLHAPEGNVLTLPETADGTVFGETAEIMNFDGTVTQGVTVTKTEDGYTFTLPEGKSWDSVDTVIKAERVGYDESISEYNGDNVYFDPTVDGLPAGQKVIRVVEGKEVYLTKGESITGRLTDECFPVKDGAKQVHFFAGQIPDHEAMYIYNGSYDFYGAKAGINPNDPEDITKPNPLRLSDEGETIWAGGLTRLSSTDGRITFDGFTFKGDTQLRIGYRNTEADLGKKLNVTITNCRNSNAEDAYVSAPSNSLIYSVDAEHKTVNITNNRFDGVCFNGVSYGMIFIRSWNGVFESNFVSMKNSVNIADGASAADKEIFWLRGEALSGKDWASEQDVMIRGNYLEGRVTTTLNPMWYDEYKVHILNNTIAPTVTGYSLINIYTAGSATVDGKTKYYSNIDTADINISGNKVINPYELGLGFVNIGGTVTAEATEQVAEINAYKAGNIKITHNEIDYGTVSGNAFGGTAVKGYDNLVFDITCNKYGETVNPVKSGLEGNFAALNVTDETAHKEVITVEDTAPTVTAEGVGHKECTFCGELIAENLVIPATGEAKIGEITYATLEEALSAAAAGQTVKLNKDVSVDFIAVDPEITLDLNGHALTADYVIGFKGSAVIDGSADHGGKLLVPKDKMALDTANGGYLPVYEENGYIFTTVKLAGRSKFVSATQFAFSPVFETFSHEALVKGFENSNVNIIIRLTWEDEGNYRAVQDFTYLDERVARVIGSYDASEANYGLAFAASFEGSEAGKAQNVQVTAVVVSETGVEIAGTPVSFAGV